MVERLVVAQEVGSSNLLTHPIFNITMCSAAGSAGGLGPSGRRFDPCHIDHTRMREWLKREGCNPSDAERVRVSSNLTPCTILNMITWPRE